MHTINAARGKSGKTPGEAAFSPADLQKLHRIVSEHVVDPSTRRCRACNARVLRKSPLCKHAAHALRVLSSQPTRPPAAIASARNLSHSLRVALARHTPAPGGRACACGFVYSSERRVCPTQRELMAHIVRIGQQRRTGEIGLCHGQSEDWELTTEASCTGLDAIEACKRCPLLARCRQNLEQMLADKRPPRSIVMAAMAFDRTGKVIDTSDAVTKARRRSRGRHLELHFAAQEAHRRTNPDEVDAA